VADESETVAVETERGDGSRAREDADQRPRHERAELAAGQQQHKHRQAQQHCPRLSLIEMPEHIRDLGQRVVRRH
jgi:hypothetical protein